MQSRGGQFYSSVTRP
nr:unnamed protein product [Callosobruchus chinensis]